MSCFCIPLIFLFFHFLLEKKFKKALHPGTDSLLRLILTYRLNYRHSFEQISSQMTMMVNIFEKKHRRLWLRHAVSSVNASLHCGLKLSSTEICWFFPFGKGANANLVSILMGGGNPANDVTQRNVSNLGKLLSLLPPPSILSAPCFSLPSEPLQAHGPSPPSSHLLSVPPNLFIPECSRFLIACPFSLLPRFLFSPPYFIVHLPIPLLLTHFHFFFESTLLLFLASSSPPLSLKWEGRGIQRERERERDGIEKRMKTWKGWIEGGGEDEREGKPGEDQRKGDSREFLN